MSTPPADHHGCELAEHAGLSTKGGLRLQERARFARDFAPRTKGHVGSGRGIHSCKPFRFWLSKRVSSSDKTLDKEHWCDLAAVERHRVHGKGKDQQPISVCCPPSCSAYIKDRQLRTITYNIIPTDHDSTKRVGFGSLIC